MLNFIDEAEHGSIDIISRAPRSAVMCPPSVERRLLFDGRPPHSSLCPFILKILWNKDKLSSLWVEECIFSLFLLVFLHSSYFSMPDVFASLSKRYLPTLCSFPGVLGNVGHAQGWDDLTNKVHPRLAWRAIPVKGLVDRREAREGLILVLVFSKNPLIGK